MIFPPKVNLWCGYLSLFGAFLCTLEAKWGLMVFNLLLSIYNYFIYVRNSKLLQK